MLLRRTFAFLVMSMFLSAGSAYCAPIVATLDEHHRTRLVFPPAEAVARQDGSAHLACNISEAGTATNCNVTKSSAPDFGLAALQMVMTSHFLPAYDNGKPVASTWEETINFHLFHAPSTMPLLDHSHTIKPRYPLEALRNDTQGSFHVTCTVSIAGAARDCVASDGPDTLRQATLAYFTLARYLPALQNGEPVEAQFHGTLNWSTGKEENNGFE